MPISLPRWRLLGAATSLSVARLLYAADAPPAPAPPSTPAGEPMDVTLDQVVVTAQLLNDKRAGIQTQTGASTYTIDDAAIAATPGGDNTLLNQVIMQAPDVAQDSFGQFHVRGDHNDLQYRLNGIILPEGISVFGQSLSPRLISSLQLITGALPAEYGLRTAGIIDMTTKSGAARPGRHRSRSTAAATAPSSRASTTAAAPAHSTTSCRAICCAIDLGIESPDGSSDPIHDHTTQYHGFGYFEDILDPRYRLALILGTSNDTFQIPDRSGLEPSLGSERQRPEQSFPGHDLNENQRELTSYAIAELAALPGCARLAEFLRRRAIRA